ncbi:MAG: hypothetical protein F4Z08_02090 [Chloroflexi bacterium]|nr:hypothetical protein [Chloroflexota bacterium]
MRRLDPRRLAPRRMDEWPIAHRVRFLARVVALLLVLAALPTAHDWWRATTFTADVVFGLPGRPITWFSGDPSTTTLDYAEGGRGVLTLPAGDGEVPGLILALGADPAEADDERVVRFTEGLARIGFAVLLTQSEDLDAAVVLPVEIGRLTAAFDALAAHPRVRDDRVGYVGLSAGGSLTIVAAAQPEVAGEVGFVVAIGPYYDASSLAASVLSESFRGPDGVEPWDPARISERAVDNTLRASLDDPGRASFEALGDEATIEEAEAFLAGLAPAALANLEGVSPSDHIDGLRAPLYLLHDRADRFVPWVESEALVADHEPALYHRLDLFDHVEPDPGNLRHAVRDGWRLLRLLAHILGEFG